MKISPCAYCGSIPMETQRVDTFPSKDGDTYSLYSLFCPDCPMNFSGEYVGLWRDESCIKWWNSKQERIKKWEVPVK